jgi:hypothetical protein
MRRLLEDGSNREAKGGQGKGRRGYRSSRMRGAGHEAAAGYRLALEGSWYAAVGCVL